ncbi:hypothetical protein GQR58_024443 [Nymphon striatum]|nr:hypothetical protein GQR58_024443 [Nymphon striatum]
MVLPPADSFLSIISPCFNPSKRVKLVQKWSKIDSCTLLKRYGQSSLDHMFYGKGDHIFLTCILIIYRRILSNQIFYEYPRTDFNGRLQANSVCTGQYVVRSKKPQAIKVVLIFLCDTYTFSKTVQVSSEVDNHQLTVCNQTNPKRCVTFDLSEFAKNVARIDHSQTIVGDLIFKKTLVVKGNITQTGTIDGVDLKLFYKHSVHEDGDEYVNGTFTITTNTTVVISGDLECDNINGVDLSAFVNRTLRINRDETVLSEKIFTEEVIVDGEVHADKFIVKGLINEVNITDLHKNALYVNRNEIIEGVLKFQDFAEIMYDLEVSGEINDIDLSEEAVTTNTQQVITGRKTMVNVDSYKHVDVTGTVNGYNLTELFADTLNTIENQTVSGHKNFQRATFENLTCETVNGKSTDTYVTLEGNQTVNSNLIFRNHTKFEEIYVEEPSREVTGSVRFLVVATLLELLIILQVTPTKLRTQFLLFNLNKQRTPGVQVPSTYLIDRRYTFIGLINGENITDMDSRILRKNRDENVTGVLKFEGKVIFRKNVTVRENKTVDGEDLDQLKIDNTMFREKVNNIVKNISAVEEQICFTIKALDEVVAEAPYYIDYRQHPIISEVFPPLAFIFYHNNKYYAARKDPVCNDLDFFCVSSDYLIRGNSPTESMNVEMGEVRMSSKTDGVMLLLTMSPNICENLKYDEPIIFNVEDKSMASLPVKSNAVEQISLLKTKNFYFTSFTLKELKAPKTLVFRVSKDLTIVKKVSLISSDAWLMSWETQVQSPPEERDTFSLIDDPINYMVAAVVFNSGMCTKIFIFIFTQKTPPRPLLISLGPSLPFPSLPFPSLPIVKLYLSNTHSIVSSFGIYNVVIVVSLLLVPLLECLSLVPGHIQGSICSGQ